jgi:hypothetical protein
MDVASEEDCLGRVVVRHRTDIEALNRDAKRGTAVRYSPSGDLPVNTVWM